MYSLSGKAAIISDLHLGNVTCLHHQILHFLDAVHSGSYSLLVIVGDLLENPKRVRLESRDWKVLSKIRKMSNDLDIIWIVGNHDNVQPEVVAGMLGIQYRTKELRIVTKKGEVVCLHGHQYDKYITKHPFFTGVMCYLYLFFQRIDRRHRMAHFIKRATKWVTGCAPKVKKGALEEYNNNETIVCGHTHAIDDDGRYKNEGSWCELTGYYVEINEEGEATLHQWQEKLTQ